MIDLGVQRMVENHIDTYKYEVPNDAIGNPWPTSRVEASLQKMRESLVDPYWVDSQLRDTFEQVTQETASVRACAVVADDKGGTLLAFDPVE
jgi:hypothetical protein